MAVPLLEVRDVWKSYDGRRVLRGAELAVAAGAGVLIWGRNGSGKTTLLNLLGCLDRPDRGAVLLEGRDLTGLSRRERARVRLTQMGFVFQDHNLLEEMTVRQNLLLPVHLRRGASAEARADELLERFDLRKLAERRPASISMGERQKVAIARALANRPPVLLADEPTASLDEEAARDLLDLLRDLRREGRTVVLASHDPLAQGLGWPRWRLADGTLRRAES